MTGSTHARYQRFASGFETLLRLVEAAHNASDTQSKLAHVQNARAALEEAHVLWQKFAEEVHPGVAEMSVRSNATVDRCFEQLGAMLGVLEQRFRSRSVWPHRA
jgi:hypothetical protein